MTNTIAEPTFHQNKEVTNRLDYKRSRTNSAIETLKEEARRRVAQTKQTNSENKSRFNEIINDIIDKAEIESKLELKLESKSKNSPKQNEDTKYINYISKQLLKKYNNLEKASYGLDSQHVEDFRTKLALEEVLHTIRINDIEPSKSREELYKQEKLKNQIQRPLGKSEFEYEQKDYLRRKKEWDKNKLEEKFHYTDTYEKEKHYGITGKIKRFFRKLF